MSKDVFVDGAKDVLRFQLLKYFCHKKPLQIIHVVRDPRAYVASYLTNIEKGDVRTAAKSWTEYHTCVEKPGKDVGREEYLRVRYEDICESAAGEMDRIFEFLRVVPEPVIGSPRTPHHVIGNRMMASFDGRIALDERYKTTLDERVQPDILAAGEPLASGYGYTMND